MPRALESARMISATYKCTAHGTFSLLMSRTLAPTLMDCPTCGEKSPIEGNPEIVDDECRYKFIITPIPPGNETLIDEYMKFWNNLKIGGEEQKDTKIDKDLIKEMHEVIEYNRMRDAVDSFVVQTQ